MFFLLCSVSVPFILQIGFFMFSRFFSFKKTATGLIQSLPTQTIGVLSCHSLSQHDYLIGGREC